MSHLKIKVLSLIILIGLIIPQTTGAGILTSVKLKIPSDTMQRLYTTGGESGVLMSPDEGQTWAEIGPNLTVNDLVVDNDYLFIATNEGIYRKTSNNWQRISPKRWRTTLISQNSHYFLAATGRQIRLTTNPQNFSVSWTSAIIDLPEYHRIKKFRQLETSGDYAYAIAEGIKCIPQPGGSFICLAFDFYIGSSDGGYNWSLLKKDVHYYQFSSCLAIDSSNPSVFAFGGYDGLKIMQWDTLLKEEYRWAVADCQFVGQNLVIGSFDAFGGAKIGLQYSPDYGQIWHQSDLIDKVVYKVAHNRVNDIFYAIGQEKWGSSVKKLYKLNLSNIIEIKDYKYSSPREMIFSNYIP